MGMKEIKRCRCACHLNPGIKHARPCCTTCKKCKLTRVKLTEIQEGKCPRCRQNDESSARRLTLVHSVSTLGLC
jgi:hypothetical protein